MAYASRPIQIVYYNAPFFVKNLMSSFSGFKKRGERYGSVFEESLKFVTESQNWSNERLAEYQARAVEEFVRSSVRRAPYYREEAVYKNFSGFSSISDLPLLSKETVREKITQFYSSDLKSLPHSYKQTGGTTGTALSFPVTSRCFQREYAFRALHYSWGGVSLHKRDKIAICAGHPVTFYDRKEPPFWVYDWANNWLLFSSYHLSEGNLASYVRELERFGPLLLGGYPSTVYILALAHKKYGTGKLRLRSVFTASETLLGYQRKTIEQSFNTKVFNWYGNSEMCANIMECAKGELHLKLEHSYVEILNDKNQACLPGETGRLVCTGFGNEAFPLIRYEVGDWVTIRKDQNPRCEKGGLLLENLEGRTEDYIITPDGRWVGGLSHLFKDSTNVVQAQLFQEKVGEVVLRIVKTPDYSAHDEKAILKEATTRLGSHIRIVFEYVDELERTSSGKLRLVVSRMNQGEILKALINA